jgi:hypothetical protein
LSGRTAWVFYTFALRLFFKIVLLFIIPAFVMGNNFSLRDFEGFQSTIYSKSSGFPFLKVYYRSAVTEKPKLGFLKLGLSFLKVQDLLLKIDARQGSKSQILQLFQDVCEKRGVRYATVEPISIEISSADKKNFNFRASKGKFTTQQSLKLWGDVLYSNGDEEEKFTSISLKPDLKLNSIICSFENGKKILPILFSEKGIN